MGESVTKITLASREFIIVGTAHVSNESVQEVENSIRSEKPDTVCIEIDEARYKSISQRDTWTQLSIPQVLKQGKGFLLLANLVLSSFQKRIGLDLGVKPGEEMIRAIAVAQELGIPFEFADREINTTFRRAWGKTGFWGKNKMLAAMISSIFVNEKLSPAEIESLKEKSALENMLDELAHYLPSIKTVLIDERDRYLATKIFQAKGTRILAVVGAGHVKGIISSLQKLSEGQLDTDLTDLEKLPPPKMLPKILGIAIPVIIVLFIASGFIFVDFKTGLDTLIKWVIFNGGGAAIGCILALANPITILLAIPAAPIATLNPFLAVGVLTGLIEYKFRKPKVEDFEKISEDITTFKGFYKNRIIHILVVFFLSSMGGLVGNYIFLFPAAADLIKQIMKFFS
jgi:pheromone shutdown-related protein TraB